jgi:hypothetical protein
VADKLSREQVYKEGLQEAASQIDALSERYADDDEVAGYLRMISAHITGTFMEADGLSAEPTCCTDCMGKPGQDGKIFHKPGCSVEWVARERAMQELAGLNENGLPDGSLQVNRGCSGG